ncbi:unnamed protein product [Closterium sp. Naga37s-1]|nr:unnamed protein product [Closterium sp. Naga37s-1]
MRRKSRGGIDGVLSVLNSRTQSGMAWRAGGCLAESASSTSLDGVETGVAVRDWRDLAKSPAPPLSTSLHLSLPPLSTTSLYHLSLPPLSTTSLHHLSLPPLSTTSLYHLSLPPLSTTLTSHSSPPLTSPSSLSQVEFFPNHRFSAAAVWQWWRESYPDGRACHQLSLAALTPSFSPLLPSHAGRVLPQPPLQCSSSVAAVERKLPRRALRPARLYHILHRGESPYRVKPILTCPDGHCAQPDSITFFTGVRFFSKASSPFSLRHTPLTLSSTDGRCAQPDSITFFTGVSSFTCWAAELRYTIPSSHHHLWSGHGISHHPRRSVRAARLHHVLHRGEPLLPSSLLFQHLLLPIPIPLVRPVPTHYMRLLQEFDRMPLQLQRLPVPTHYMRLLQEFDRMPLQLQRKSALAASKLRLMMCGSAACPDELMRRWHQVTGQRLLERYGMTEFAMALTNPLLGEKKSGSVGVPLRGVKVKLADTAKDRHSSSGSSSSCARTMLGHLSAPGAFSSSGSSSGGSSRVDSSNGTWSGGWGELLVKSPGMFLRYWNRPQETEQAFDPQGWFRTGDIASVDSHGYWQIHGRASVDIIKTRGFKVSALEIESKLLEHPLISEAAVLGVPERQQGEAVAAVVVLGAAQQQHTQGQQQGVTGESFTDTSENACPVITLDELRKWAAPRMAHYKVPSRLRVVATMPRNAMGKVNMKDLLKSLFAPMQQS